MSDAQGLRRRWGSRFELADLLEAMPGGTDVGVRDFALITLAGQLSARYPRQLVFKGGFVLRHVHGLLRFSKDVDATRHEPPRHKLDSAEVARAIREASIRNIVQFTPDDPATDTARSLDFDNVRVEGDRSPALRCRSRSATGKRSWMTRSRPRSGRRSTTSSWS